MSARIPPQAIDAEQAVIGGLMILPDAVNRIGSLTEADFYRRDHRLIFRAILALADEGKPFDAVTLGEWFETKGQADQVSMSYLIDIASNTPSAANVGAYAAIVAEKSLARRLIEAGTELANAGFAGDAKPEEVLDAAVRSLMALVQQNQACEFTLKQAVTLAFHDTREAYEAEGRLRGITTGYPRIDARLGGWHDGDLIFIGARPSMGKTALMVNLALNAAAAGHSVGVISGEQSAMQLGQRSIAVESRVPAEVMRNGRLDEEHWPRMNQAIMKLVGRNVRILDRSAPTLDEIARTARRWKQEHGLEVLFVDYLQRIRFKGAESRIEEVSEVARGLKTLARDLGVPVVCLAQVKAEVDKRNDCRPGLGDIANSDEATREADLIGFLYRDEVYKDETPDKGIAELNFEKNRHGPTGQFRLHFNAETMMFAPLEYEHESEPALLPRLAKVIPISGRDRAAGVA